MSLEIPIPTAIRIIAKVLFGIDHVGANAFGDRIETRPGGKIARGLGAAMEGDDQRCPITHDATRGGHEETVFDTAYFTSGKTSLGAIG